MLLLNLILTAPVMSSSPSNSLSGVCASCPCREGGEAPCTTSTRWCTTWGPSVRGTTWPQSRASPPGSGTTSMMTRSSFFPSQRVVNRSRRCAVIGVLLVWLVVADVNAVVGSFVCLLFSVYCRDLDTKSHTVRSMLYPWFLEKQNI